LIIAIVEIFSEKFDPRQTVTNLKIINFLVGTYIIDSTILWVVFWAIKT